MDIITKEVITSLLKRIAKLENEVPDLKKISTVQKVDPVVIGLPASEDQKNYIRKLNGKVETCLTKKQAGHIIDCLLRERKEKKTIEPEEVDTEEAGIEGDGLI